MRRIGILMLVLFACSVSVPWQLAQAQPKPRVIPFDAPGAGTMSGQGTFPQQNTAAGTIVGFYVDANNVSHGFVRDKDGTTTPIDVPGAGTGAGQGTFALSINPSGEAIGFYIDSNDVSHGYVLTK